MLSTPAPLSLNAIPQAKAVPDFWNAWVTACIDLFPNDSVAIESIRDLEQTTQAKALFIHLNDPLESLILDARSTLFFLTPAAWLALTVVVLRHATVATKVGNDDRAIMICALNRARTIYNASEGQPIDGVSIADWLALVPSKGNPLFWTVLFQHGLQLVHPVSEPFYWFLREYWLTTEQATNALDLSSDTFGPDLAPWGFARAVTLPSVQSVLRCGKRWVSRQFNTLDVPLLTCTPDPRWIGIYQFSLWLVHVDTETAVNADMFNDFKQRLNPAELPYWLVLAYDIEHHPLSTRELVAELELHDHPEYARAVNIVQGLQLMDSPDETMLAMQAWSLWLDQQKQQPLHLPELN